MTNTHPPQSENSAWYCSLIGTLIYFLLFFPFLGGSLCLVVIALEGQSLLSKIWVTVMYPAIALSMPMSIYFMWRSYLKNLYDRTYLACAFPLILLMVVIIIESFFRI
jgi:hypothetical protein